MSVDVGYASAKGNGKIDVTKYFNTNDYVKKEALRSGVSFTTATDNSEIKFINKLLSVEFDIGFGFSKTNNHFDRLDITLTDSINKDEQIVISLLKKSNTVSDLAINGVVVSKVTVPFYSEDEQNLHYDNFTRKINIGNVENLLISKTANGEYFDGFTSEYITLSLKLSEVKGDSTVFIYKINNQTMSRSGDTTVPHLYYDLYSGGKKTVGDMVTITRLYLSDVLAPSFSVDYSVKGPDGNYVTDINGVILSPENMDYTKDYVFEIPAYGRYFVSIKIADAFGNDDEFAYGINISDSSAPEISLEDNNTQTVKVGSSITIRKATAVDNINGKVDIYAYLVSPTLYTQEYKIGDTVVLNHKGIYHVYYYAYDEVGNVSFAEYTIVAE